MSAESDRDQAIQLLNDAKMAVDGKQKVDLLKGIMELVIHKQPALLSEFLPEVTLLQTEPAVPVRKQLVEFLEAAVQHARPSLAALTSVLSTLARLLDDSAPAVVKRAISACSVAFRPGHSAAVALGKGPHVPLEVGAVWEACAAIRQRVSQLAAEPVSDSVRIAALKFMEFAALLITADSAPKGALAMHHALLNPAQVARDAEGLMLQLLGMVKQPALAALSGPVAIVAIKAVGALAAQRPQYVGRVLPSLLTAASANSASAVDGQSGVAASVNRAVKDALMAVLRCRAPQALPWQRKIVAALHTLGAGEQADAEVRRSERQAKRERARSEEDDSAAKRQRPQEPEAAAQLQYALPQPALAPQPQLQPLPPPLPAHYQPSMLTRLLAECADHTPEKDLREVLAVMGILAAENDLVTLNAFVEGLSNAVLLDAVICNMDHLPPRELVCGDAPAVTGGLGDLAGLMQGLAQPELAGQEQPHPAAKQEPPEPQPKVQPPPPPRQLALRRAQLPVLRLVPVALSAQQAADLRLGSIRRVLQAEAAPVQHLRASVLASLATRAPVGDTAADMVLAHLLGCFHQPKGYDLALKWLYRLFIAHADIRVTSAAKAAASAHITQPERKAALASALDDDVATISADEVSEAAAAAAVAQLEPPAESAAQAEEAAVDMGIEQGAAADVDAGALVIREEDEDDADEGGGDWAASLAGSQYETVLLAMVEGLREQQEDPKDRTIARLLMDAPALPQPAVATFLADVAAGGGEWASLALQASFDIIMGRPRDRAPVMDMVLNTATAPDEDVRTKAVRLTANRLHKEAFLQKIIEDFAYAKLCELVLPAPQQPAAKPLENGAADLKSTPSEVPAAGHQNGAAMPDVLVVDAATAEPAASVAATEAPSADASSAQRHGSQQSKQKGSGEEGFRSEQQKSAAEEPAASAENGGSGHKSMSEDVAMREPRTGMGSPGVDDSEAAAGNPGEAGGPEPAAGDPSAVRRESGSRASSSQGGIGAPSGGLEAQILQQEGAAAAAPHDKRTMVETAAGEDLIRSTDDAKQRCDLFCALCTKKPDLLPKLLIVYGKAGEVARGAIKERAPGLARVIGAGSPVLAELLRTRPPPGSLPLLLNMLHTLTESKPPPVALVSACMEALRRSRDARFLVPALASLDRQEALLHLPRLLALDAAHFTAGIHRLLLLQPETGEPLLAPQEILVRILSLKKDEVPLKQHMAALTACLTMKMPDGAVAFPPQSLASTLQQLVIKKPLPFMFMRFTIQANAASRELRSFVLDILSTLVGQAVWSDTQQWRGWVVCVRELLPDSLPVLLQLPLRNLARALEQLPAEATLCAAEFVGSDRCGPLPRQTVALVQERAATVIAAAAAKAADGSAAAQAAPEQAATNAPAHNAPT